MLIIVTYHLLSGAHAHDLYCSLWCRLACHASLLYTYIPDGLLACACCLPLLYPDGGWYDDAVNGELAAVVCAPPPPTLPASYARGDQGR
jgi:hypothetical protein